MDRYTYAREAYAALGVDTDAAIKTLSEKHFSIHCWQGDDVQGFENSEALSGGIQATGNYPGKARNVGELMSDIDTAFSLIPGKKKVNLHAIYAVTEHPVERSELEPQHFDAWVDFAAQRGLGLDINPTLFSHKMAADGLTLSHPDKAVRDYWIKHCKAMRTVGEYFGKKLGVAASNNIWIPDGYKQVPADRLGPRVRLMESLDDILSQKIDPSYLVDTVESKLFGVGVEAYTVGSHEFYMNYAATRGCACLLDNGHYHPTELVSDKIPSMLAFFDTIALHITRGVRWDSDHVVVYDDELKEIASEIVRCGGFNKAVIGTDYFDASINRVAAWVVGARNVQKAFLNALVTPFGTLKQYQDSGDFTRLLAMGEELKNLPFGDVWNHYCELQGVPAGREWIDTVEKYENDVLSKRG